MKAILLSTFLLVLGLGLDAQTSEDSIESYQFVCLDGIDNDGDGLIDCEDPDCIENNVLACLPCYNNSYAYADSIEQYIETCTDGNNLYTNPENILGQPDANNVYVGAKILSLGDEGSVQLKFTDNLIANSGSISPDIGIIEVGASREGVRIDLRPYDAFTKLMMQYSKTTDLDGDGFYYFGDTDGGIDFFDIDSLFTRYFEANRLLFDGILLTDLPGSSCNGTSPGADIDAVCGGGINREICDNNADDDGDGLTDENDPDCSCQRDEDIIISRTGFLCRDGLELSINTIDGASYQWFKDGQAIAGATDTSVILVNTLGYFEVLVDRDGDCVLSEQTAVDLPLYEQEIKERICVGESIEYLGTRLDSTGIYVFELASELDGCDSIVYFNLELVEHPVTEINRTICRGDSLFFFGETIREAGSYMKELISTVGCDSTILLNLELDNILSDTFNLSLCQGDQFIYRNDTIDSGGQYSYTFNIPGICDSLILWEVEVLESTVIDTVLVFCSGDSIELNGEYFKESGSFSRYKVRGDTCVNYKVDIYEEDPVLMDTVLNLCPGDLIIYLSEIYFTPGFYTHILPGFNSCDTIISVEIIGASNSSAGVELHICEGETLDINGETLSSPGLYEQLLVAENGCDSLLNISVVQTDTTVFLREIQLCSGESVMIADSLIDSPGDYVLMLEQDDGCFDKYVINVSERDDCEQCILPGESNYFKGQLLVQLLDPGYYSFKVHSGPVIMCDKIIDRTELERYVSAFVLDEYLKILETAQNYADIIWNEVESKDLSNRTTPLLNYQNSFTKSLNLNKTDIFKLRKQRDTILKHLDELKSGNRYSKSGL